MDLTTEILLRPGEPGDTNLILHNWLREGYKSTFARTFGHEVWNREHERFLREDVLPRSTITVAADATMPDVVCAFAVTEGPGLHFVYCKPRWRGLGIVRHLLSSLPPIEYATHRVDSGERYKFNPYPLFLGLNRGVSTWHQSQASL